jgi:hypothetical protein
MLVLNTKEMFFCKVGRFVALGNMNEMCDGVVAVYVTLCVTQ